MRFKVLILILLLTGTGVVLLWLANRPRTPAPPANSTVSRPAPSAPIAATNASPTNTNSTNRAAPRAVLNLGKPKTQTPPPPIDGTAKLPDSPFLPTVSNTDSAEVREQATRLEQRYAASRKTTDRIQFLQELSLEGTTSAAESMARLIKDEKSEELKLKLLDQFLLQDEQVDLKIASLTALLDPDEPDEVRLTAISGLGELRDPRSIPWLQGLMSDPDPLIRRSAKTAIEAIQAAQSRQKPAPKPQAPVRQ